MPVGHDGGEVDRARQLVESAWASSRSALSCTVRSSVVVRVLPATAPWASRSATCGASMGIAWARWGTGVARALASAATGSTPSAAAARKRMRSRAISAAPDRRSGRRAVGFWGSATSKRRLGVRQVDRFLAEPDEAAGAQALDVAAHRHEREIGGQDLPLASNAPPAAWRGRSRSAWTAACAGADAAAAPPASSASSRRKRCGRAGDPAVRTARTIDSGSTPGWRSNRLSSMSTSRAR